MLIFDIGFYRGEDTKYYLDRGWKVVAFEANPVLADAGRQKFTEAIASGQLILNACGIGASSGQSVEFFLNLESDEWSTFYKEAAINWGPGKSRVIEVPCITPREAFAQFGIPDYLKADIEGYDIHVAEAMKDLERRPQWVSFEASNILILRNLLLAGYQGFKVIDQSAVPRARVKVADKEFCFDGGTGPFGDDTEGPWLSFENALYLFNRLIHDPFAPSMAPGHWFDVHATLSEPADKPTQLVNLKNQIEDVYQGHCGMSALPHKPSCPLTMRKDSALNSRYTTLVANDWKGGAYYDSVEGQDALNLFWGRESVFLPMFEMLSLEDVIELACGHGRHYEIYGENTGETTLIDVNQENIDFCRARFASRRRKPVLMRNNGSDFAGLADGKYSAIFCYDAMVHFELFDVISYLSESFRVLRPGARALYHHSNFTGAPGIAAHATHDFGWRNYMSADLFTHLSSRIGFLVERQTIIPWGGKLNLDCVTLLRKPA